MVTNFQNSFSHGNGSTSSNFEETEWRSKLVGECIFIFNGVQWAGGGFNTRFELTTGARAVECGARHKM